MRLAAAVIVVVVMAASCNSDKNLKKGDQYWAIGEYYEASLEYAKAYAKTPSNDKEKKGMIAYKVAEANRKMNYYAKAQAAYRNAVRFKYTDTLTHFYLAEMERYNKEYKQAAKDYQLFLDKHPNHKLSLMGLESCANAQAIKDRGSAYTVKLDKNFNSNYADFSPAFNGEDIYFSSTRRDCNGDDVNGVTGMKHGDIFFMQKTIKDVGNATRLWQRASTLNTTRELPLSLPMVPRCTLPVADGMPAIRVWPKSTAHSAAMLRGVRPDSASWPRILFLHMLILPCRLMDTSISSLTCRAAWAGWTSGAPR